ncbi:MAG: Nif3-like dinuclear metal center hexameric protein [Lachnospiraceae bacterium]
MNCGDIITVLHQQSSEHYACDWDNVGLLTGDEKKEVHTIYIALDGDDTAIQQAVEVKADMLLTHHPMIFRGLKKVTAQDFIGRRVIQLIQNDIAYYAMHTNFDVKGMAELAAKRMQLLHCQVLERTGEDLEGMVGIGRIGELPNEITLESCAYQVKQVFNIEKVKVFGSLDKKIKRAAICPGSGKSVIAQAIQKGAQVLITGDIDHHDGIDAIAQGLEIIDAGHYGLEKIFIPYMKEYLEQHFENLQIIGQPVKEPFVYL